METKEKITLITLGDIGVGKSALIMRMAINEFYEDNIYDAQLPFYTKKIPLDDLIYELILWDSTGKEKYNALSKIYCKNASLVVLTYDVTNKESFEHLQYWNEELMNNSELTKNKLVVCVVGTK